MATFQKHDSFIADVFNGVHNFSSDTIKGVLTNTAPLAANSALTDLTEIAAGNGYVAGGVTIPITSSTQTGGVLSVTPTGDVVVTATGGSIGPFRYLDMYNDTSVGDRLIGFYDHGSSVTLQDGESLTLDAGATLFTAT